VPEAAGVSGPETPTPWPMQRGAMEQRAAKQQRIEEGRSSALACLQKVANVKSTSNLALQNIMKILEGSAPTKQDFQTRGRRASAAYTQHCRSRWRRMAASGNGLFATLDTC